MVTGGGAGLVSTGLDNTSGIASLSSLSSGTAGFGLLPAWTDSLAECFAFCSGDLPFVGTAALGTFGVFFLFSFSRLFSFSDSEEWSHLISLGFLFGVSSSSSSSDDSTLAFPFFGFDLFSGTFSFFRLGLVFGESSSSSSSDVSGLVFFFFGFSLGLLFFGLLGIDSSLSSDGLRFFLALLFAFLALDRLRDVDLSLSLLECALLLPLPTLILISGDRDPEESLRCFDLFLFPDGVLDLDLSFLRLLERPLLFSGDGDLDRREFRPRDGDLFRDLDGDLECLCFGDLDLERDLFLFLESDRLLRLPRDLERLL